MNKFLHALLLLEKLTSHREMSLVKEAMGF